MAYDSIGAAAEESQVGVATGDLAGRFAAACRAIREWSLGHVHEYSLVFGSPVPDFRAPQDTTRAASRVPAVLSAVLVDASRGKGARRMDVPLTDAGAQAIAPAVELLARQVPAARVQAGLMVWSGILGAISFELYGHHDGSVAGSRADREAYFESCIVVWAAQAGIS